MLQSCAILLSLALLPCNGGITMSGPAVGSLSFASPPSKALPLSYFRTTSLRTYLPSVDASFYPLQLRGGREDSEVPLGLSSEEVEDEGTIQPGPGVKVEEGLVEKMKKNAEEVRRSCEIKNPETCCMMQLVSSEIVASCVGVRVETHRNLPCIRC